MLTEARHQFTQSGNDQSLSIDAISFLELEIAGLSAEVQTLLRRQ